jgi:argininosuccinate lyase
MDAFILLKQLKDDGLISEEYYEKLFEGLIKIKPELEAQIREDRAKGLI